MNSKIVRLLVSFLIAFALWFLVISMEYTETELSLSNIPISFYGDLADGLQIISDTDDMTVDLTLSGNRFTLNKLEKSDIKVWVNVSKIGASGEKNLSYEVEFLNGIRGVNVVKQEPSEIRLTVAQWADKNIPVRLEITNQDKMPDGFVVDLAGCELKYSDDAIQMIHVSGPRELVDQIESAKVTVDMAGRTEDVQDRYMVALCDGDGDVLQTDLSDVTPTPYKLLAKVPVLMVKEIPLEESLLNVDQIPLDYVVDQAGIRIESNGNVVDSVVISGPKGLVEQIGLAKVVVDMADKTETVIQSKRITLCNAEGNPLLGDLSSVKASPGTVEITVPVEPVVSNKEIQVIMPDPLKGGGLTAADVQVRLEFDKFTVQGSPSALAELDSVTLPVIKLSNETDSFVDRVYIVTLPDGVQTLEGSNEVRIKVSLTIPPMETKMLEIPASQIELLNLPEGMLARVYGSKLKVWIRGRGNILSQIRATDISASVDLAGAQADGYYPVIITIKKYDNVGVITDPNDANHTYRLYVQIASVEDLTPAA